MSENDNEPELTKQDIEQLKINRSADFKQAFKQVTRELVLQASIPHHFDMACGIDNLGLCKEVLKELLEEL